VNGPDVPLLAMNIWPDVKPTEAAANPDSPVGKTVQQCKYQAK
jgi:hypothetical protein